MSEPSEEEVRSVMAKMVDQNIDELRILSPLEWGTLDTAAEWHLKETAQIRAEVERLMEALQSIAEHTNPDDEQCYRADDREGCLDTVHALAKKALNPKKS